MDARIAKKVLEEQEWLLFRLAKIEERYLSKEMNQFLSEVWHRVASPGFDDWTDRNLRDFTILSNVHDLEVEMRLARESIGRGETWNNQHFRRIQQLDEAVSSLLREELRLGLINARAVRKGHAKAYGSQQEKGDRWAKFKAFVVSREGKRSAIVEEAASHFGVSARTIWRALKRS
jgi:hypothetical protein